VEGSSGIAETATRGDEEQAERQRNPETDEQNRG
jgi:hypothetical protein